MPTCPHVAVPMVAASRLAALAGVLLAGRCLGQTASSPGPLAGPRVTRVAPPDAAAKAATKPSIIARDADGRVVIPECSPEEAALGALGLGGDGATPASLTALAGAKRVLSTRSARLDEFVMRNVPLLTALGAGSAGRLEQAALVHKAYIELAPIREGGTLQQQLASALGPEFAPAFDATLKDFWNAVAADRQDDRKPDGQRVGRIGAIAGVKLESLGREIERAFARVSQSGEIVYRYLTEGLTLRDDQVLKLRTLIADFLQRGGAEGNAKDAPATFLAALSVLDDSQRPIFARNLKKLSGK